MRAADLQPGKTAGEWTAEELQPQLPPHAWGEFLDYFQGYLRKRPDFNFSAYDLDAFFLMTGT